VRLLKEKENIPIERRKGNTTDTVNRCQTASKGRVSRKIKKKRKKFHHFLNKIRVRKIRKEHPGLRDYSWDENVENSIKQKCC